MSVEKQPYNDRGGPRSFRDAARPISAPPELPSGDPLTSGVLTQMGKDNEFREEPRWHMELDVSTVCGHHDAAETTRAVFGRVKDEYCVRHFPVERLCAAEYRSMNTPSRRNPQHASITAPVDSDDVENHKLWWQAPERVRLKAISAGRRN